MTRQRICLVAIVTAFIGMVLACSGSGAKQEQDVSLPPPPSPIADLSPKPKEPPAPVESDEPKPLPKKVTTPKPVEPAPDTYTDEDRAVVEKAERDRDQVIAKRAEIKKRNDARTRKNELAMKAYSKAKAKYDNELEAFKKAKLEYDSLRRLDFANRITIESRLDQWLRELIKDFPGTDAAKEASRRVKGLTPKTLKVPPVPSPPSDEPTKPGDIDYEDPPGIPEVPTLAEVRERRLAAEREQKLAAEAAERKRKEEVEAELARKAKEEINFDGLVVLDSTIKGVSYPSFFRVTGTVENRRGRSIRLAEIRFLVYDENNGQIGTAVGTITDLEAGGRWSFRATAFVSGGKSFKLSKVIGR